MSRPCGCCCSGNLAAGLAEAIDNEIVRADETKEKPSRLIRLLSALRLKIQPNE